MSMKKIMSEVNEFFNDNVAPLHKITSVEPRKEDEETGVEAGWDTIVEVVEEREYMKKYAKDEMIGVYQASLNNEFEIISYSRISTRFRSSVDDRHKS